MRLTHLVWHPFTVHYSTSCTSHIHATFLLEPHRADQKIVKNLTFCWALQFPPPSFLVWRHQAVILVFLQVLLFPAGQESVLLGRTQTLTLGAVLRPAGGRVSGNPVLHLPLLLFREAGIGHHVSIKDRCHGRPTYHSVTVAHTHTVFKRATALNLQEGKEKVEMLTSWESIILKDSHSCSSTLQIDVLKCTVLCLSSHEIWLDSWLWDKQKLSRFTTNHRVHLKKRSTSQNKTVGTNSLRISTFQDWLNRLFQRECELKHSSLSY